MTGRKVRTECSTFKKVANAISKDPDILYRYAGSDPYIFAVNFTFIEENYGMPSYDASKTKLIFHKNGSWEHANRKDSRGQIPIFQETSTLYNASHIPEPANECYMATLDTCDNWNELQRWRIISTRDNYMFDVFFLIKIIVNQLNEIKNGNAFPVQPKNPFTNSEFSSEFWGQLNTRIKENQIKIAPVLAVFLRDPTSAIASNTMSLTLPNVTEPIIVHPSAAVVAISWIQRFESAGLRYYKDWDGTGFWDLDNHPMSRVLQEAFGLLVDQHLINMTIVTSKQVDYYWKGPPNDPGAAQAAEQSRIAYQTASYYNGFEGFEGMDMYNGENDDEYADPDEDEDDNIQQVTAEDIANMFGL